MQNMNNKIIDLRSLLQDAESNRFLQDSNLERLFSKIILTKTKNSQLSIFIIINFCNSLYLWLLRSNKMNDTNVILRKRNIHAKIWWANPWKARQRIVKRHKCRLVELVDQLMVKRWKEVLRLKLFYKPIET
jgi:hypothetical protein